MYALEIQMFTEQRNTKKLKQLYQKALTVKSAIPHPRILGIIRECGGKMHMHDQTWSEAATDFFEVRMICAQVDNAGRARCYCLVLTRWLHPLNSHVKCVILSDMLYWFK